MQNHRHLQIETSHQITSAFLFQRVLALIYLAHASDVLENAFAPLSDEDYDVAMKRVRYLLGKFTFSRLLGALES